MGSSEERFRRAMSAVCAIADRVPSSILVVCCLDDFYEAMKGKLARSMRDRLEQDPEPIRLQSERTLQEVTQLIGRRLSHLYDQANVRFDEADETIRSPRASSRSGRTCAPATCWITAAATAKRRWRKGAHRDRPRLRRSPRPSPCPCSICSRRGTISARATPSRAPRTITRSPSSSLGPSSRVPMSSKRDSLHGEDDRRHRRDRDDPRRGDDRAPVRRGGQQEPEGRRARQAGRRRAQGSRHAQARPRALDRLPITPWIRRRRGDWQGHRRRRRRTVLEDADCLTMLALKEFRAAHASAPNLAAWLGQESPLSQLHVMRDILALERFGPRPAEPAIKAPPAPLSAPARAPVKVEALEFDEPIEVLPRTLILGKTEGIAPRELSTPMDDCGFTCHAAFLGGTGSGKTTLALGLVEQLLLADVPVVPRRSRRRFSRAICARMPGRGPSAIPRSRSTAGGCARGSRSRSSRRATPQVGRSGYRCSREASRICPSPIATTRRRTPRTRSAGCWSTSTQGGISPAGRSSCRR